MDEIGTCINDQQHLGLSAVYRIRAVFIQWIVDQWIDGLVYRLYFGAKGKISAKTQEATGVKTGLLWKIGVLKGLW